MSSDGEDDTGDFLLLRHDRAGRFGANASFGASDCISSFDITSEDDGEGRRGGGIRSSLLGSCSRRKLRMPFEILVISFLNSFVLSFPLNFFGKFVTSEVGMTPTQFSQFYAFTFLPFSLKPVFAFAIEKAGDVGVRKKNFLVICNALIGLHMLFMATIAKDVWHVFLIGFSQSIFEAMAGMVVALILIDIAGKDQSQIPQIQTEQTSARYLGTFSALILTLPISGCGTLEWSNRAALMFSSVIPFISAGVATQVTLDEREEQNEPRPRRSRDDGSQSGESAKAQRSIERKALAVFVPSLIMFELLAVLLGLHSNFVFHGARRAWQALLVCSFIALFLWISLCTFALSRLQNRNAVQSLIVILIPCIYLFVVDASPNALEPLMSFKFNLFDNRCQLQGLSIISIIANVCGMLCFTYFFSHRGLEFSIVATTMMAGLADLLNLLKTRETRGNLTVLALWIIIDSCTSYFSAMYLIAKEVIATKFSFALKNSPRENLDTNEDYDRIESDLEVSGLDRVAYSLSPGVLYSVYLTCFDVGASASGFLTAALVSGLEISSEDFSRLPALITMCSAIFIGTIAFVPALRHVRRSLSQWQRGFC